ncbi:DUF2069 domain-containing protein [Methylococcus sp. EFPC2]|uniref:DUF2069 domain-containing protein n=1 Tax=Methylococcus sp. EFPC2 TaxID=2812648 RepID=UPI001967CF00|nr:DUF2069 domain-containing protein [Methylococcus sp. EFPC2]QSA97438.1 DUF2069 domain-containing protein [Methylococcus sp. EFPC2]
MSLPGVGALVGYFGLLGLWIAWSILPGGPHKPPTALLLMISTLPLLPWLRGLLYDRRTSYLGLAVLSLVYFIHGVGALTSPAERIPAGLEIGFSLTLFLGALFRLRSQPSS